MKEDYKILIVDDQEINRKLLGNILRNEYALLFASNGREALSLLRDKQQRIALVLLDIVMPTMDGYAVLRAMQQDTRLSSIPVLVTTQKDSEDEELRAFSLGAYDYITKPYNPEIIRHRVSKTIELMKSADRIQRAEQQAQTDPLTGLYNRRAFEEAVSRFLRGKPLLEASFLMLDLDNFKVVNDLYGHIEGDQVLVEAGSALMRCFREGDLVARLGGDEFAAFIPSPMSIETLTGRLEDICRAISSLPVKHSISCTIGVCRTSEQGEDYQMLYQRADLALLSAKRLGKNRFQIYGSQTEPGMPVQLRSMEWLLDEIKEGILITDRQSREILYLNKPAAAIAGKEKLDCLGTTCYDTIWGRSSPCPFCVSPDQVGTGFHECDACTADHKTVYRIITRMMEWNGKPARLQFIWDYAEEKQALSQLSSEQKENT